MDDSMTAAFVTGKWQLAQGYFAVEVEVESASQLQPFDDGALIDAVPRGHDGVVKTYPLFRSSSRRDAYVLGIRHDVSGEPAQRDFDIPWNHGDEILVGKPQTTPVTVDTKARYILLGGGLGIAVIAGVARKLASSGKSFELHNFARTPARAVFLEELCELERCGKIAHHFERSAEQLARNICHAISPTHANSQIYCSGPPAFMDLIQQRAREWVYDANIHKIFLGDISRAKADPRMEA
ncbi:oxidoreductase [Caballeronia sp. LjRoot29]|uniref:oxidoreductase n=1 Tax=Caballeronia sp. LjRoot29 TaxID=3342315 RepID=UPI003ECE0CAE